MAKKRYKFNPQTLSYEEIAKRASEFSWTFPKNDYPRFLNLFVKNVGSMAKGGIWER